MLFGGIVTKNISATAQKNCHDMCDLVIAISHKKESDKNPLVMYQGN